MSLARPGRQSAANPVNAPLESLSDAELARLTQAGSLDAFEQFVVRYQGRVYGFVSNSCRQPADAREITQDTFLRAFQAIGQYDPSRSFAPWLFAIARRKCIDHFRAHPVATQEMRSEEADLNDPAELLAREEDRRGLWDWARRRLPESQFQALWLRYVEDLSVAEIARALRKTGIHVKVLLFRARAALGREFQTAPLAGSYPASRETQRPAPLSRSLRKETHAKLASQV